ncbi:MAG: hypothetical protein KDG55_03185 [Rhodocyclaceae bacterium]|nr:hypothetical protein [Rhodocyclaceae bacterium]
MDRSHGLHFGGPRIATRIESALCQDTGASPELGRESAIHMSDWMWELERQGEFSSDPDALEDDAITGL